MFGPTASLCCPVAPAAASGETQFSIRAFGLGLGDGHLSKLHVHLLGKGVSFPVATKPIDWWVLVFKAESKEVGRLLGMGLQSSCRPFKPQKYQRWLGAFTWKVKAFPRCL